MEQVAAISGYILEKNGMISPETTMSGKNIYLAAKKEFPRVKIALGSFITYLSNIVAMPDSKINCQGRKKGYYISAYAESLAADEDDEEKVPVQTFGKEKALYELLNQWLMGQGYAVKITASMKSHGIWGNPDITGILTDDLLGNLCLEVVTIEAKISTEGWQRWIFEAVAHRRFANRSYFAFAHPAELSSKIDPEIRFYCELYQIGAIAIILENEDFENLKAGKLKRNIESEDADIRELYVAPLTQLPPKPQRKYLKTLGITTQKDLYSWGVRL